MKRILTLAVVVLVSVVCVFTAYARATKSMVGKDLPELRVDFVGDKPEIKGKPMILEFWATWCPPCRESIPHLNEVYKKYKDRGLVIVGVTDEDNQTIRKFTKKIPIDYFPATDRNGKLGQEFGVQGIPHAVLVNKEGKIVWEGHPMSLTDAEIEKIL